MNAKQILDMPCITGQRTCRMVSWRGEEAGAERELDRLLREGWTGSMHECSGLWLVDVVRQLRSTPVNSIPEAAHQDSVLSIRW